MKYRQILTFALGMTGSLAMAQTTPVTLHNAPAGFTLIDFPGATSTQIWGVTPRGDMTGVYVSADKVTHGFLLRDGRFTTIDYPGSAVTFCNSINARGDIAGEYATTATGPHHGFLLRDGQFRTVDYPGATTSLLQFISPGGEMLGQYTLSDSNPHSFVVNGDKFTNVDYPGATQTVTNVIGPHGELVGAFSAAGVSHAYLQRNSDYTVWDYPGVPPSFTNAVGANAVGDIVGRYRDPSATSHGYLLSAGQFSSYDCPGATFTGGTGITPRGEIVGRCTVGGVSHGFLLKPAARRPRYEVTDLGTLGGSMSNTFGMNNASSAAGISTLSNGATHATLWRGGTVTDLGTLGGLNSLADNPNGSNQVAVNSDTRVNDPLGEDFCGFGTHQQCLPAVWSDGKLSAPFKTLGGNNASAFLINDRGQSAGAAETARHDSNCAPPQVLDYVPAIWDVTGRVQALALPKGDTVGAANGINDKGEAVGSTGTCDNTSLAGLALGPHAILWQNGVARDLGTLGGKTLNVAATVNDLTEVVGSSSMPNETDMHGFLWTPQRGMTDLGTLGSDTTSVATLVNNSGQIVGASCDPDMNCRAFYWERGEMLDLNDLVTGNAPMYLIWACWINEAGEVVGQGVDKKSGELHAFIARPVSAGGTGASAAAPASARVPDEMREMPRKHWDFQSRHPLKIRQTRFGR